MRGEAPTKEKPYFNELSRIPPDAEPMTPESGTGAYPCQLCLRMERISRAIAFCKSVMDYQLRPTHSKFVVKESSIAKANEKVEEYYLKALKGDPKLTREQLLEKQPRERVFKRCMVSVWYEKRLALEAGLSACRRVRKLSHMLEALEEQHAKCDWCGMLFGELHIADPRKTPVGCLCQWCVTDYQKWGKAGAKPMRVARRPAKSRKVKS